MEAMVSENNPDAGSLLTLLLSLHKDLPRGLLVSMRVENTLQSSVVRVAVRT